MQKKLKKFFWLALLGHLLLFMSFSVVLTSPYFQLYQPYEPKLKKKAFTVLPAYMAQEPSPEQQKPVSNAAQTSSETTKKIATEKPEKKKAVETYQARSENFSAQMHTESSTADKTFDAPLLKLLYKATDEKFIYPQIARDFRVVGNVQIQFLVSPDGELSNITLVKSSGFGPYDNAALAAVHAMSPVKNVAQYLQKPKVVTAVLVFN